MTHLLLLIACILSVEVFIRSNFLSTLDSIYKVTKKVMHVLSQKNISDHWKEKIIPAYALSIMKYSIQIVFIVFLIFSFFIVADLFINDFILFTLSFIGNLELIFFASGYVFMRRSFIK